MAISEEEAQKYDDTLEKDGKEIPAQPGGILYYEPFVYRRIGSKMGGPRQREPPILNIRLNYSTVFKSNPK